MTWSDITKELEKWRSVLWLNQPILKRIRGIVFVISASIFFITIFLSLPFVSLGSQRIYGVFFLSTSVWLFVFMVEMYVRSYYFAGLQDRKIKKSYTYEVVDMLLIGDGADVSRGIFFSELGDERMMRLGLRKQDVEQFYKVRQKPVSAHVVTYAHDVVTPDLLTHVILDYDVELKEFLAGYGITPDVCVGAVRWVSYHHEVTLSEEEWWSREQLSRIPGIGKNWSQGITPILDRFADSIQDVPEYQNSFDENVTEKTVDEIEMVLSRSHNANVMLVGETYSTMLEAVVTLGKRIEMGEAYPEIEHKRIKVLYSDRVFAETKDTQQLEQVLHSMFTEVVRAEDIIIVIKDLHGFIEQARTYSVNLIEFMRSYISSPLVQIVGFVEHRVFEMNMRLYTDALNLFDRVTLSEDRMSESLLRIVERDALFVEKENPRIHFMYTAIHILSEQIKRLYSGAEQRIRIRTMLSELALKAKNTKHTFVTKQDVEEMLQIKTGIPGSAVSDEEKTKLLDLEALLQVRVVGQEHAIRSIADALRKKRSGISDPQKPIGSFLFLGPTGVGKTETARSLADVFFGGEDNMIRLDMTEYSGADALGRLIGDHETGKPGLLVSKLREYPYSLLLLDEFEKASREVHDLFLQILDEGVFSDVKGEHVQARNIIIIATSNAEGDLIWNMMSEHKSLEHVTESVINEIIETHVFRPELLNRFDGTIVFHPLLPTHLAEVTERMLQKLRERIERQGYYFSYEHDLIEKLIEIGSDPKFGARPIARVISERVEGAIARQILQGKIKTGDTVHISAADLV